MTSTQPGSALDHTVKLSARDWGCILVLALGCIASFFELRGKVTAAISTSQEINARQDKDIEDLQTDVRELRASR